MKKWIQSILKRESQASWNHEAFLRKACDQMLKEINWDSINSGCLDRSVSLAKTEDGKAIIIAVLTNSKLLEEVIHDTYLECKENGMPVTTPLWLYVPKDLELNLPHHMNIVLKKVVS